jgi:hypothetical protein
MNSPQRTPTTAIQIRVTAPMLDRLEDMRRIRPRVPPLAALVREILEKALDDPPKE